MSRTTVQKKDALSGWPEVDAAIRKCGEIDVRTSAAEAAMNAAITGAKQACDQEVKPLADERKTLAKEIHIFIEQHQEEFGTVANRTSVLTFGRCGMRKSPGKISQLRDWTREAIIEKLKRYRDGWLVTKHEISKETIIAEIRAGDIKPEAIEPYGMKYSTPDEPWFEPDIERIGG